jgi:hypothetical protein
MLRAQPQEKQQPSLQQQAPGASNRGRPMTRWCNMQLTMCSSNSKLLHEE